MRLFWVRTDLKKRFKELDREITQLKARLNDIHEKKELWFAKKNELKKKVNSLIDTLKAIKLKKDTLVENIKELKMQRSQYNKQVGDLIYKIKELNKQRQEVLKKSDIQSTPDVIKDRINKLEQKIETEALSFRKEQKLMKQINKLRGSYTQSIAVSEFMQKIIFLSKEIDASKAKAQEFHKKIQEHAQEDQSGYLEFIKTSQTVAAARTEQEKAFRKFLKLKRAYITTNDQLRDTLLEAAKVRDKLTKEHIAFEEEKKEQEKSVMREKSKDVEEKLKKGEKLTTDDLLVYQHGNDEE